MDQSANSGNLLWEAIDQEAANGDNCSCCKLTALETAVLSPLLPPTPPLLQRMLATQFLFRSPEEAGKVLCPTTAAESTFTSPLDCCADGGGDLPSPCAPFGSERCIRGRQRYSSRAPQARECEEQAGTALRAAQRRQPFGHEREGSIISNILRHRRLHNPVCYVPSRAHLAPQLHWARVTARRKIFPHTHQRNWCPPPSDSDNLIATAHGQNAHALLPPAQQTNR